MARRADKVLVIDDETRTRSLLARLLRDAGYDVVGETCGAAALRAVEARNYDIVITDVFMPYVDGVAIARAARTSRLQDHRDLRRLRKTICRDRSTDGERFRSRYGPLQTVFGRRAH